LYYYKIFNSVIKSDLKLFLLEKTHKKKHFDIEVTISKEPNSEFYGRSRVNNQINISHSIIFQKQNELVFEIKNGRKIIIHVLNEQLDPNDICIALINIPLGYCLYQQKKLVLHSSAISNEKGAYMFLGESGTGKSTICSHLLNDFDFVSEDVCLLEFKKNKVFLYNGPNYVKLDKSHLNKNIFNINNKIEINSDRLDRSLYKVRENKTNPHFLKKIFILEWSDRFEIKKINGKKLFASYLLNLFSAYPFDSCKLSSKLAIENFTALYNKVEFFLISRNKSNKFIYKDEIINQINN